MIHKRRNVKLLGITFSYIQALFEEQAKKAVSTGILVKKVRKRKDRNEGSTFRRETRITHQPYNE